MESSTAILEPELITEEAPSPEFEPEGLYEVVNGQIVEKPLMGAYEASVATDLFKLIIESGIKLEGRFAAEALFSLDAKTGLKRRPDLAYISYERWPKKRRAPRKAAWDFVPDLAIEVISPSNLASDTLVKLGEYFRAGAQRVWVIYPVEEQIYIYESPKSVRILFRDDRLEDPTLFPGLSLPLDELFESEEETTE